MMIVILVRDINKYMYISIFDTCIHMRYMIYIDVFLLLMGHIFLPKLNSEGTPKPTSLKRHFCKPSCNIRCWDTFRRECFFWIEVIGVLWKGCDIFVPSKKHTRGIYGIDV